MSDKKLHGAKNLQDTQWTRLIEEVRQWPCDAPEWEGVQEFIDQVQAVAEQKGRERKESGRIQLQEALDQLWNNHEGDLVYFGFSMSDLSNWQASFCPIEQVVERTKLVKELLGELAQFQLLEKQWIEGYPTKQV